MSDVEFIATLEEIVRDRLHAAPESSYTARLAGDGIAKAAQKLGEEAVELAIAAVVESDLRVTEETADLLYHLLVVLSMRGIPLTAVMDELNARHQRKSAPG